MTRDDIIQLARESGLKEASDYDYRGSYEQMPVLEQQALDGIIRFANLVAAAEREACAEVCDEQAARSEASMLKQRSQKGADIYSAAGQTAHWCAAAIRARGNQPGGAHG